jgi:hypothetical protein
MLVQSQDEASDAFAIENEIDDLTHAGAQVGASIAAGLAVGELIAHLAR